MFAGTAGFANGGASLGTAGTATSSLSKSGSFADLRVESIARGGGGSPATTGFITGDGGMNMCLAELATAAAHELKIVCAVLNDAALSLIDIKQQRDQRRPLGTRYAASDYARIAEGFGVKAFRVASLDELGSAARAAHAHAGPVLIDIETDPSGYGEQLARLRG